MPTTRNLSLLSNSAQNQGYIPARTIQILQWRVSQPSIKLFFLLMGITALLLRLHEAVRTSYLAHPDEIFQTLEPAHRLAYGYGIVTWEWRDGIRSWVFPAFLALVMKGTAWMGQGSSGYLIGIRILLSITSLVTVWFGFMWAKRAHGTSAAIISATACAVWYELIGFAPRAMPEVLAAHILLIGLYVGVYSDSFSEKWRIFIAALLCGIAMSLRIQLTPAALFLGLYFCRNRWRRCFPVAMAGILSPVLLFGLVDLFTWGHFLQSFYLYFWENAVEAKSLAYGSEPWYWYLVQEAHHFGPIISILALLGVRRSPLLGWLVFIILASHSILGHKELRFLYPMLPLVLVLSALGLMELVRAFGSITKMQPRPLATILIGIGVFVLFSIRRADHFPYWSKPAGGMAAFEQLSRDPDVCGVGIYAMRWFETGGFAYLHHNVPMVLLHSPHEFDENASGLNAVVAGGSLPITPRGWTLSKCWNGGCLYERPGICINPKNDNINEELRRIGE